MASTKTKSFSSAMAGAPVLSGTAGALISVLDAVLVTGFGLAAVTSLTVASGIATANFAAGHSFAADAVGLFAGITPTGLNGDKRILSIAANAVTFDAAGISDQTATGTMSAKVAPAGWTKTFAGTNLASYKMGGVEGTGFSLRVDDTGTTVARVRSYESLTDVNTGTGLFPALAQWAAPGLWWSKSNAASTAARAWQIYADDRGIYFFVNSFPTTAEYCGYYFGDMLSLKSNDPYACLLRANSADRSSNAVAIADELSYSDGNSSGTGLYLARAANTLGGSVQAFNASSFTAGLGVAPYQRRRRHALSLADRQRAAAGPGGDIHRARLPRLLSGPATESADHKHLLRHRGHGAGHGGHVGQKAQGHQNRRDHRDRMRRGFYRPHFGLASLSMAAHSYWRLTGFLTDSGALELSQAQLYNGALPIAQIPVFTISPSAGSAFPATLRWDDCAKPGFALVWSLASAVDSPLLQLGAGSSAATFPKDLVCQYSDDGATWTTHQSPLNIAFPGAGALTAAPGGTVSDPDYSSMTVNLHFDEANGATTCVDSVSGLSAVCTGAASVTTTASVFGAASLSLGGGACAIPANPAWNFGTGDFTADARCTLTALGGVIFGDLLWAGGYQGGWCVGVLSTGALQLTYNGTSGAWTTIDSAAGIVSTGVVFHVGTSRIAGIHKVFVAGFEVISVPNTNAYTGARAFRVGAKLVDGALSTPMLGRVDELRILKGKGAYTGQFIPRTAPYGPLMPGVFVPVDPVWARRWRASAPALDRFAGSDLPVLSVNERAAPLPFLDAYNGGVGVVYGTVKEKTTPVNTPLRRRVILIDEASRIVIRETWSNNVTGEYSFPGVKLGVPYTVLSYDHTDAYRAVVADGQIPELMP